MKIKATIVKTGILAGNSAKKIRAAVSEGLAKGLEVFHRRRQREKFTVAGSRRYHFEQRSRKYEQRKLRAKGHKDPNVWSGVGRRDILRRVDLATSKTKATATGKWSARFLNFSRARRKGNKGRSPDHRKEIEATVKRDTDQMAKLAAIEAARFIDRDTERETTRI